MTTPGATLAFLLPSPDLPAGSSFLSFCFPTVFVDVFLLLCFSHILTARRETKPSGQKQCPSPGWTLPLCGQMLEMLLKDELPGLT